MSAGSCVAFFGVRYDIAEDELELLETRSHPKLVAARKGGLESYWGNFDAPSERFFLFVGFKLGILGDEDQSEVRFDADQLANVVVSTKDKLNRASFDGTPALYVQWMADA